MAGRFSRLYAISESRDSVNEDLYGMNGEYAWVLDGMTGHRAEPRTPGETEGQWYVEQLDEAFTQLTGSGASLASVARDAIAIVRDQFRAVTEREHSDTPDSPAAAGVLVRRVQTADGPDEIEYLIIGDCTLVINKANTVVRVTDGRPAPREQEQIEAMQRAFDAGATTPAAARNRVEDVFVTNKRNLNTVGEYWMFSLDPEAVEHALIGTVPVSDEMDLHLMTDGFSSLIDTYHIYETWDAALCRLHSVGAETIVSEIRTAEDSDPMLRKYPRTKPSDDATLLSVTPTNV